MRVEGREPAAERRHHVAAGTSCTPGCRDMFELSGDVFVLGGGRFRRRACLSTPHSAL